jgi:hypothetical protein
MTIKKLVALSIFVASVAGASLGGVPAQAASYQWCADYIWMPKSCGSSTYQQCLDTLSGQGGSCVENPSYTPPNNVPHRKKSLDH